MLRHTLIMDQETRWNSAHTMLKRFLLQKNNFSGLHRIWNVWHSNTQKSWVGNFAKRCGIAKNFIADVVNICDKENSCISAAVPSAKFIMITLQEIGCKGVVELKKTFQHNMNRYFYGKDVQQQCNFIEKRQLHVVATLLDLKLKTGFFTKRGWSSRVIAGSVGCSTTNRNN